MLKFCDPSTLSKFFRGILRVWILDYILQLHLWQTGAGIQILSGWLQRFSKTTHCHFCLGNRYGKFLLLFSVNPMREKSEHVIQYPTIKSKEGEGDKAECLIGEWQCSWWLSIFSEPKWKQKLAAADEHQERTRQATAQASWLSPFWPFGGSLHLYCVTSMCFMHGILEVGNTCKALGQHLIGNRQQH